MHIRLCCLELLLSLFSSPLQLSHIFWYCHMVELVRSSGYWVYIYSHLVDYNNCYISEGSVSISMVYGQFFCSKRLYLVAITYSGHIRGVAPSTYKNSLRACKLGLFLSSSTHAINDRRYCSANSYPLCWRIQIQILRCSYRDSRNDSTRCKWDVDTIKENETRQSASRPLRPRWRPHDARKPVQWGRALK